MLFGGEGKREPDDLSTDSSHFCELAIPWEMLAKNLSREDGESPIGFFI